MIYAAIPLLLDISFFPLLSMINNTLVTHLTYKSLSEFLIISSGQIYMSEITRSKMILGFSLHFAVYGKKENTSYILHNSK